MPEERRFCVRQLQPPPKLWIYLCDACLETPLNLILPIALVLKNSRTSTTLTATSVTAVEIGQTLTRYVQPTKHVDQFNS